MYAMTQTWLNITYMMSTLSQFAHNSNNTHWKTLKQVFQYVQRTLDIILKYKLSKWLKLLKYSDSDWEKDLKLRRFTSEYIFKMINESVFWSLKCQKIIILFFYEAEYMILTETIKKAVWMKKLLKELELKKFETVMI